jgi:hypothetical protein
MTRRIMWLGVGAVLGGGSTVWARRRLDRLSRQLRTGQATAEVVTALDAGARQAAGRVRAAVDTGRAVARRRESELRRDFAPDDRVRDFDGPWSGTGAR